MKFWSWFAVAGGAAVLGAAAGPATDTSIGLAAAAPRQSGAQDSMAARQLAVRSIRSYYRGRSAGLAGVVFGGSNLGDPNHLRNVALGEALNRSLDSATVLAPRDSMIAAARVWHRITTGHYAAADSMATSACVARIWNDEWCSAMRGFTKHNLGDFATADSHFEAALRAMPEQRRCLWTDLSLVLNDVALTNIMKDVPCVARGERNAVVWWLADPMWSAPGNERRTGHYARWTEATLADTELQFLGYARLRTDRVGTDLAYYLRIGERHVHNGYELGCSLRGRLDCKPHNTLRRDRFMPWATAVSAPFTVTVFDYSHAPRQSGQVARIGSDLSAGYFAPINASQNVVNDRWRWQGFGEVFESSAGKVFTIREAQTGMVLRRSGPTLLAAFDPRLAFIWYYRPEPNLSLEWGYHSAITLRVAPVSAVVAVSGGPRAIISVSRPTRVAVGEMARVSVEMEPTADSALVSLEASTIGDHEYPASSRHRFAVWRPDLGLTGRVKISDVILYSAPPASPQPTNAAAALALMIPRTTVYAQEQLGLFWETYGLSAGDEPEFELSVAAVDSGSTFRALGNAMGLLRRVSSSLVRWKPPPVGAADIGSDGEASFTMQVALTNLRNGEHVLTMTTRLNGDSVAAVSRAIQIKR